MAPKIDPAVLRALSLDATTSTISRHGGGGFSETLKVSSTVDGKSKSYFVKTGGKDSEVMFTGTFFLSLIHSNRQSTDITHNTAKRSNIRIS